MLAGTEAGTGDLVRELSGPLGGFGAAGFDQRDGNAGRGDLRAPSSLESRQTNGILIGALALLLGRLSRGGRVRIRREILEMQGWSTGRKASLGRLLGSGLRRSALLCRRRSGRGAGRLGGSAETKTEDGRETAGGQDISGNHTFEDIEKSGRWNRSMGGG